MKKISKKIKSSNFIKKKRQKKKKLLKEEKVQIRKERRDKRK